MKCSSETLQNLLCFMYKKTHIVFFRFSFRATLVFLPNEFPGLCRHRLGHSLGKNIKLHEVKNDKNYLGFLIHNIW